MVLITPTIKNLTVVISIYFLILSIIIQLLPPFCDYIWFMLQMQNKSVSNEILDFYNHTFSALSKSPFTQQRYKLQPEGWNFLFHIFTEQCRAFDTYIRTTLTRRHTKETLGNPDTYTIGLINLYSGKYDGIFQEISAHSILEYLLTGKSIDGAKYNEMYDEKIIAHNLKATKGQIVDDLNGVMSPLQRRMMKELLVHLDELNIHIKNLVDEIDNFMKPEENRLHRQFRTWLV